MRYWTALRQHPRPVRYALGRILWRTGLCSWLRFEHNGATLRFHPSSFSAALWVDPRQGRDDEIFFETYLQPGDVVVDVGANIGVLSLAASRLVGEHGQVIAVEPHPATFQHLQHNLGLNQAANVQTHRVAVGEAVGSVVFSDKLADDENQVLLDGKGIVVPATTLDALLRTVPRILGIAYSYIYQVYILSVKQDYRKADNY